MMAATAQRKTVSHAAPIGRGNLHAALEASKLAARLHDFCDTIGCETAEVSADGKRLDIPLVLDAMRRRGYAITDPVRPQAQPDRHVIVWLSTVTIPAGLSVTIAFHEPVDAQ